MLWSYCIHMSTIYNLVKYVWSCCSDLFLNSYFFVRIKWVFFSLSFLVLFFNIHYWCFFLIFITSGTPNLCYCVLSQFIFVTTIFFGCAILQCMTFYYHWCRDLSDLICSYILVKYMSEIKHMMLIAYLSVLFVARCILVLCFMVQISPIIMLVGQ